MPCDGAQAQLVPCCQAAGPCCGSKWCHPQLPAVTRLPDGKGEGGGSSHWSEYGQPQACPSLMQSPFKERDPAWSPSLPRAQRTVTGLALPSVPNWTSIPPCQKHSQESEAVRIQSSSSLSRQAWCESWQVMVLCTRLAGPHCVSLAAQKVTASRTVETRCGNCWCCRPCPWLWRQHRPVQELRTLPGSSQATAPSRCRILRRPGPARCQNSPALPQPTFREAAL